MLQVAPSLWLATYGAATTLGSAWWLPGLFLCSDSLLSQKSDSLLTMSHTVVTFF